MPKTVIQHEWIHATHAYQNDYCKHCGLIFDSDLGWTSADGVNCQPRQEPFDESDFSDQVRSYASFRSLRWDRKNQVYVQAYGGTFTVDQIESMIAEVS